MLRILFILLAVVAAVLALVLKQPVLYAAAGVLLLIALLLIITTLRRQYRKAQEPYVKPQPPPPAPEEEDMKSLGILEIRPKASRVPVTERERAAPARMPKTQVAAEESKEDNVPAQPEPPRTEPETPRAEPAVRVMVKERASALHAAADGDASPSYRDVILPVLQAARSALQAQTVCLLKQEAAALHYRIEVIVSQNAYARSGGSFATGTPLINAVEARRPVTVRRVGADALPVECLGYYRESLAVRQVALAPITRGGEPTSYFLVADTMEENALSSGRQHTVLVQFAALVGTLLEDPRDEVPSPFAAAVRPRRDIIAEEMEKARAKGRSLALALVHLNRAEALSAADPEAVEGVEQALEKHIRRGTRRGRVERFGELTYGVFVNGTPTDVEAWAVQLQNELAGVGGQLEGGVSIGIALLRERHADPDAFREDATTALREAFETGTCTMLE